MSCPAKPNRKKSDYRTRQTALKHETFAWAASFYPDDPERVMALAGYKPSLAAYKKVLESRHVKQRMQDIAERVLCDGWRQAADIVVAEPTKEAVIMKLWEFATSISAPAASQVTALNALARNYGISVGVEEGAGGDDDDERPPPLHKRIEAGKFQAALTNGAPVNSDHDQPSSDSTSAADASETPSPSDAPADETAASEPPSVNPE